MGKMHSKRNENLKREHMKWPWVRESQVKQCQWERIRTWRFQQLRHNSGKEKTGHSVRWYQLYSWNNGLSLVSHSPEEDGVKADIIMVFQFPSAEQRAVRKKKIHSILNQKIRNTRALSINALSVQVNGK